MFTTNERAIYGVFSHVLTCMLQHKCIHKFICHLKLLRGKELLPFPLLAIYPVSSTSTWSPLETIVLNVWCIHHYGLTDLLFYVISLFTGAPPTYNASASGVTKKKNLKLQIFTITECTRIYC